MVISEKVEEVYELDFWYQIKAECVLPKMNTKKLILPKIPLVPWFVGRPNRYIALLHSVADFQMNDKAICVCSETWSEVLYLQRGTSFTNDFESKKW